MAVEGVLQPLHLRQDGLRHLCLLPAQYVPALPGLSSFPQTPTSYLCSLWKPASMKDIFWKINFILVQINGRVAYKIGKIRWIVREAFAHGS